MNSRTLDRTLAVSVLVVAVFHTVAALSLPVPEWKASPGLVLLWVTLLSGHAAAYWLGWWIRDRFGLRGYAVAQGSLVFALSVLGLSFPLGLGLYAALTMELVVVAAPAWHPVAITAGGILLFASSTALAAGLYRGATAGLMVSIVAIMAHAAAALFRRLVPAPVPASLLGNGTPVSEQPWKDTFRLTAREEEVLSAVVDGLRNNQIATRLAVSERTVKSHLASIYQKMGVNSRTAAVSLVLRTPQGPGGDVTPA